MNVQDYRREADRTRLERRIINPLAVLLWLVVCFWGITAWLLFF
jgi:hypothetical protein